MVKCASELAEMHHCKQHMGLTQLGGPPITNCKKRYHCRFDVGVLKPATPRFLVALSKPTPPDQTVS